jgi:hypothetical protein
MKKSCDHSDVQDLRRYSGFAMWDRELAEALKRLNMFRDLCTGWVLTQVSTDGELTGDMPRETS